MKKEIGKGIDVSRWQGEIDWEQVASDGIEYAMIKASQGAFISNRNSGPFIDSFFERNITQAHKAGIRCGAYHYAIFTDVEKANEEYEFFFNALSKHKDKISLYVALDLEDSVFAHTGRKAANTDLVLMFVKKAKEYGFVPALYSNRNFLTYYLEKERLSEIPLWQAHYYTPRSSDNPPKDSDSLVLWQWTEKGSVKGIKTNVDLDVVFAVPALKSEPSQNEPDELSDDVKDSLKKIIMNITDLLEEAMKLM